MLVMMLSRMSVIPMDFFAEAWIILVYGGFDLIGDADLVSIREVDFIEDIDYFEVIFES